MTRATDLDTTGSRPGAARPSTLVKRACSRRDAVVCAHARETRAADDLREPQCPPSRRPQ